MCELLGTVQLQNPCQWHLDAEMFITFLISWVLDRVTNILMIYCNYPETLSEMGLNVIFIETSILSIQLLWYSMFVPLYIPVLKQLHTLDITRSFMLRIIRILLLNITMFKVRTSNVGNCTTHTAFVHWSSPLNSVESDWTQVQFCTVLKKQKTIWMFPFISFFGFKPSF